MVESGSTPDYFKVWYSKFGKSSVEKGLNHLLSICALGELQILDTTEISLGCCLERPSFS